MRPSNGRIGLSWAMDDEDPIMEWEESQDWLGSPPEQPNEFRKPYFGFFKRPCLKFSLEAFKEAFLKEVSFSKP